MAGTVDREQSRGRKPIDKRTLRELERLLIDGVGPIGLLAALSGEVRDDDTQPHQTITVTGHEITPPHIELTPETESRQRFRIRFAESAEVRRAAIMSLVDQATKAIDLLTLCKIVDFITFTSLRTNYPDLINEALERIAAQFDQKVVFKYLAKSSESKKLVAARQTFRSTAERLLKVGTPTATRLGAVFSQANNAALQLQTTIRKNKLRGKKRNELIDETVLPIFSSVDDPMLSAQLQAEFASRNMPHLQRLGVYQDAVSALTLQSEDLLEPTSARLSLLSEVFAAGSTYEGSIMALALSGNETFRTVQESGLILSSTHEGRSFMSLLKQEIDYSDKAAVTSHMEQIAQHAATHMQGDALWTRFINGVFGIPFAFDQESAGFLNNPDNTDIKAIGQKIFHFQIWLYGEFVLPVITNDDDGGSKAEYTLPSSEARAFASKASGGALIKPASALRLAVDQLPQVAQLFDPSLSRPDLVLNYDLFAVTDSTGLGLHNQQLSSILNKKAQQLHKYWHALVARDPSLKEFVDLLKATLFGSELAAKFYSNEMHEWMTTQLGPETNAALKTARPETEQAVRHLLRGYLTNLSGEDVTYSSWLPQNVDIAVFFGGNTESIELVRLMGLRHCEFRATGGVGSDVQFVLSSDDITQTFSGTISFFQETIVFNHIDFSPETKYLESFFKLVVMSALHDIIARKKVYALSQKSGETKQRELPQEEVKPAGPTPRASGSSRQRAQTKPDVWIIRTPDIMQTESRPQPKKRDVVRDVMQGEQTLPPMQPKERKYFGSKAVYTRYGSIYVEAVKQWRHAQENPSEYSADYLQQIRNVIEQNRGRLGVPNQEHMAKIPPALRKDLEIIRDPFDGKSRMVKTWRKPHYRPALDLDISTLTPAELVRYLYKTAQDSRLSTLAVLNTFLSQTISLEEQ